MDEGLRPRADQQSVLQSNDMQFDSSRMLTGAVIIILMRQRTTAWIGVEYGVRMPQGCSYVAETIIILLKLLRTKPRCSWKRSKPLLGGEGDQGFSKTIKLITFQMFWAPHTRISHVHLQGPHGISARQHFGELCAALILPILPNSCRHGSQRRKWQ